MLALVGISELSPTMEGLALVVQGPMLIGFTFNVLLYGMMIAQVYMYYTTYKEDKRWMKAFVLFILVADTANTVFDFIYLYRALITHFGDNEYLAKANWLFATDPAITGIIACLVQLFFAWRLGALLRSRGLVAIVCLGAVAGLAGAVVTSFEVCRTPQFVDFRNFKSVVIVWLASESITDLVISGFLVCFLHKQKSGIKESDLMIDRIIRLSVQTGVVTSVVATLDLIFFLAYPNGLHLIFNFPLCKLYSNSLMSSLNSRRGWRFKFSSTRSSNINSTITSVSLGKPTSPLSPPLSPRALGTSPYDNFNNDNDPASSYGRKVHPGHIPSVMIPPSAMRLGKRVQPNMLVDVESRESREIGLQSQE